VRAAITSYQYLYPRSLPRFRPSSLTLTLTSPALPNMKLYLWSLVVSTCLAVPIHDWGQQPIQATDGNGPYTRNNRDPYDHKVDSYGNDWQPLPWRNGDGASMMGPRNRDRERQNPDMIRPPSTDHGSMANMRWSFADSHMRIEVRACSLLESSTVPLTRSIRKEDGPVKPRFES